MWTPGRGDEAAGKLLHLVRSELPRPGYQMLPRWSAPGLARKARAAAAICRLLREARGTSPPVHGPVWADVVRVEVPSPMVRTPSRLDFRHSNGGKRDRRGGGGLSAPS